PHSQPVIASHVLAALQSFSPEPSFCARPLFPTGEGYGGKFIPAAAAHILAANPSLPEDHPVRHGIGVGNVLVC
ncbi:hypothetical protein C2845_PM06G04530, partial [Panicum miliaceum]